MARRLMIHLVIALSMTTAVSGQEGDRLSGVLGSREVVVPPWKTFTPTFREQPCPFDEDPDRARLTCGYVLVPEDRTDPESRLIRLAVIKIGAKADPVPRHAVVFLAGGPGYATIDVVRQGGGSLAGGVPVEDGDLIAFDQRGTGYSESSFCHGVRLEPSGEGFRAAEQRLREDLASCLREARQRGIAVDAYSTWHNAHDVRDVRRALGYEQWNLWGISWGGRLAQAVMQVDREGVRSAILDSSSPPFFPTGPAAGLRSSLDAVNDACAEHLRCSHDIGDLAGRLVRAITSYDVEPLILHVGEQLGNGRQYEIDGDVLANSLRSLLTSRESYGSLPILLDVLESRNARALAGFAAFLGRSSAPRFGTGMALVTHCRWHVPDPTTLDTWRAAEPELSRWVIHPWLGDNLRGRCEDVYRIEPDGSVSEFESDVPILILSGLTDPTTPPSFVEAIVPGLRNATVLEFPHTGHGVVRTLNEVAMGCGTALVGDYVRDPARAVDASCRPQLTIPDFLTRIRETHDPMRLLLKIRSGQRPLAPTLALSTLLIAFALFPLTAASRRLDRRPEPTYRRVRLIAWLGAGFSITGAVVVVWAIASTIEHYPAALMLGVVPWIGWGGWLSLAGMSAAWLSVVEYARSALHGERRIATGIGVVLTAVAATGLMVYLFSIGAGPV